MSNLHSGFVYLKDIDPSILQEIRYAYEHNLIGEVMTGYEAEEAIICEPAAHALKAVQGKANDLGYSLKVYEAYRPMRAGEKFVLWSTDIPDQRMKEEFYKHINKADMFNLGYIAVRSAHCRGAAVDLTLVPLPTPDQPRWKVGDELIDGISPPGMRFQDNSIDMGTGFDCMHELSHTKHPKISDTARKNRQLLCELMHSEGFTNYEKEWWHFNFVDESFPNTYFDFVIK